MVGDEVGKENAVIDDDDDEGSSLDVDEIGEEAGMADMGGLKMMEIREYVDDEGKETRFEAVELGKILKASPETARNFAQQEEGGESGQSRAVGKSGYESRGNGGKDNADEEDDLDATLAELERMELEAEEKEKEAAGVAAAAAQAAATVSHGKKGALGGSWGKGFLAAKSNKKKKQKQVALSTTVATAAAAAAAAAGGGGGGMTAAESIQPPTRTESAVAAAVKSGAGRAAVRAPKAPLRVDGAPSHHQRDQDEEGGENGGPVVRDVMAPVKVGGASTLMKEFNMQMAPRGSQQEDEDEEEDEEEEGEGDGEAGGEGEGQREGEEPGIVGQVREKKGGTAAAHPAELGAAAGSEGRERVPFSGERSTEAAAVLPTAAAAAPPPARISRFKAQRMAQASGNGPAGGTW